jgi:hypothetical protein
MDELDLVILAFACYTVDAYRRQIETINDTWGRVCSKYASIRLFYFLGEEKRPGFDDTATVRYVNLPGVADDYMSASYKQFLGLKYVHENVRAKYVICIGTDTYLNVPKLLTYVRTFDYTARLYIGGHGCVRQVGDSSYYFHSGGPGFILTHGAVQAIYDDLATLVGDWTRVCNANGVGHLTTACDVAVSYYVQQPSKNVTVVKTGDLSFLHCNYIGFPCHPHQVKASDIISCHLMSRDDFYHFTRILEENNYFHTVDDESVVPPHGSVAVADELDGRCSAE